MAAKPSTSFSADRLFHETFGVILNTLVVPTASTEVLQKRDFLRYSLPFAAERAFPALYACGMLLLLCLTFPIWLPSSAFPQVPWFAWMALRPVWLDLAAGSGLLFTLLAVLAAAPGSWRLRCSFLGVALCWLILLAGDQLRFQPWAYQGVLIALLWALLPAATAARWLRRLTISIYLYSAWSKLDATFLETMGPYFLNGLAISFGWKPPADWGGLPWIFPLGELFVAVLLCFPRLRIYSLTLATLLHVGLLWTLGPFGLNHHLGVLAWNLFLIVQNLLLFGPAEQHDDQAAVPSGFQGFLHRVVAVGMALVFALPIFEPWGGCDIWPAWGLYAPRNQYLEVVIHKDDVAELPPEWQIPQGLQPLPQQPNWLRLRLDRLSLHLLAAPIYPQHRYQLGVIEGLAAEHPLPHGWHVTVYGTANRFSGTRNSEVLKEYPAIREACQENYWFNALSRKTLQRASEP